MRLSTRAALIVWVRYPNNQRFQKSLCKCSEVKQGILPEHTSVYPHLKRQLRSDSKPDPDSRMEVLSPIHPKPHKCLAPCRKPFGTRETGNRAYFHPCDSRLPREAGSNSGSDRFEQALHRGKLLNLGFPSTWTRWMCGATRSCGARSRRWCQPGPSSPPPETPRL